MHTYEVFIKEMDAVRRDGKELMPNRFRPYLRYGQFHHSDKSAKEFRDLVFESNKNARVMISGGPARKLRKTDIRVVEKKA